MNASDQAHRRPVVRRTSDGTSQVAPTWESLSERLIREAQEAGEFDDLPGHGQPLGLEDAAAAGDMAVANLVLRNAGVAPPWIEADKDVRRLRDQLARLQAQAASSPSFGRKRLRRELERVVAAHNAAVDRLEGVAPTDRQRRRPLRLGDVLAELDRGSASPPPDADDDAPRSV